MEAVLTRPVWPPRQEGLRSFAHWLICWIVLPNLGFCLLWAVGGPPRAFQIVVTGCVGLALHRAPFAVKYTGFLLALAYSVAAFIAALFNLGIHSLLDSLRFAMELKPAASAQYIVCAAALAATLVLAWRFLRRSTVLGRPALLIGATALTMLLGFADHVVADAHSGSYSRTAAPGALFTSAVKDSGLEKLATGRRHVVIVMVESMGQPSDPAVRRRLQDVWAPAQVRERYDVTAGDTLYYGSTTSGEMRELCGRWGDYGEVLEARDERCLPASLARRGYKTEAWHSFNGSFFDRRRWYPNIGFEETRFGGRLVADGAAHCPGVFPGACDRDIPAQLAGTLKQAKSPHFLYWLTVNSHLPVLKNDALGTRYCAAFDAGLDRDFPMTCRLFQLFGQTGAALAKEITAADFPEADILIVGDHIPPFFDRRHRQQFAPDRVPWIMLRAKGLPKPGFSAI